MTWLNDRAPGWSILSVIAKRTTRGTDCYECIILHSTGCVFRLVNLMFVFQPSNPHSLEIRSLYWDGTQAVCGHSADYKIWYVFVKYLSLLWFSYDFTDHATNSNPVPISIASFSSHDTSSLIVCYCSAGILGMRQKTAWTRDMARRVWSTTILFQRKWCGLWK